MHTNKEYIRSTIDRLNAASDAYYNHDQELMSNREYDALYNELERIEEATNIRYADSPTQNVGHKVNSKLPKERHAKPMLSLDKTKEINSIKDFVKDKTAVLSWKLDGLTVVLTYDDGKLQQAVTRGNGIIGEIVTDNAKHFANVPLTIPHKGRIVIRGEAIISYTDFADINEKIADVDARYKNPRNLASGAVRQLSTKQSANKHVRFIAFSLIGTDITTRAKQLDYMTSIGFESVEHITVDINTVESAIENFRQKITNYDYPSDGLVLQYDDAAYGQSLGTTGKHPKDSLAFKWADDTKETTLREIEWSPSRTGLLNPVAIFDSVELEGTSVSRASLHNLSIIEELEIGIGDTLSIYKANMIIPQVDDNLTRSNTLTIPTECPVCGHVTQIKQSNDAKTLHCTNPNCAAKKIGSFVHFAKRDAMNIEGLSEATLAKFIAQGFLHELADIYHLDDYANDIIHMDRFGEKSYARLHNSIETSREVYPANFLYALGIDNIGRTVSKQLSEACNHSMYDIINLTKEKLINMPDIGDVIADSFVNYFDNPENMARTNAVWDELTFLTPETATNTKTLDNLSFVITGTVNHFANRNEMKDAIENAGGKVTGSVTSKTNYLINNDIKSTSSKNKKAKDLGIAIITEDELIKMMKG